MQKTTWWNDYVGLPYKSHGRDRQGLDCWGLVRLVHSEVFDTKLPSFVDTYEDNRESIEESIAQRKEGWKKVDVPQSGDVVLFRVMGHLSHVGIVTQPGYFLHVTEGKNATIERLDSVEWSKRVEGIYRYSPDGSSLVVSAAPHPLQTARVDMVIGSGLTVAEMVGEIRKQADVSAELNFDGVVWVDGYPVPRDKWDSFVPPAGSRVEFRALAGKGSTRLVLSLAVSVAAWYAAPMILGTSFGATAASALGVTSQTFLAGTQLALTFAGNMLLNAIFPVRPPQQKSPTMQGPNGMPLLTGGQNQGRQYGAIPVVLGRHRFTPPVGAISYVESDATTSYLRMLMTWGYGPLQVSDIRIGENDIATYDNVQIETVSGYQDSPGATNRFNSIYGKDVAQENIGLNFVCTERQGTAVRASNVVTVTTTEPHEYSAGWWCSFSGVGNGVISEIVSPTQFRFTRTGDDGSFAQATVLGAPYTERIINDEVDNITVSLHFPEGLREVPIEGGNAGQTGSTTFRAIIEVRQLDSDTLEPITGWGDISRVMSARQISLLPAWYNIDSDEELEPVYRWIRLSVDEYSKIVVRYGAFTTNPASNPSGNLLTRLQNDNFGLNAIFDRLPEYGAGEEGLWDVCMYGNTVYQTVDSRDSSITGGDISISGLVASVSSATIDRADRESIRLGATGEPYNKRKDAFSYNVNFDVARGVYQVRMVRTSTDKKDGQYPSGNKFQRYNACVIQTVSGFANRRPVNPPKQLAMTAMRIKATNQINGNIEGITGTVQSICLDWDRNTSIWVQRPTRNPASLYRYVLQHPANAQAVANSAIDLANLQDWHEYCRVNKFNFDMVITDQRPLYDVLMDIAAAGRASPLRADGKWGVVIDRPRSHVAQHFTPHNSWGFEGVRILPKLPHGFRVQFNNAAKGYQPDERIVYNDGYSASNATLFEGLQLPGVTDSAIVFKQARFHLAQMKLRPETYTLNADIEHLVCTRGDLVRVTHDVPMWGLGSGRIKNRISGTVLELDEEVPMDAGVQYTIRIRLEDGSSITRTVAAKTVDGYYDQITLTSSVTETQGKSGNLFMFGSLASESVELIVQSIEPSSNMTARITLVDYSPAVYDSDTEVIPAFDSQITKPPLLMQPKIQERPIVTGFISDESVMTRISPGIFAYGLRVSFRNPSTLPERVNAVEAQIDYAGDNVLDWQQSITAPLKAGAVTFGDVEEGEEYRIRLRYVDEEGRTGNWTTTGTHTVVGKTRPPVTVSNLRAEIDGSQIYLAWDANAEPDIIEYEVRTSDYGWGGAGAVFRGDATSCLITPAAVGSSRTWFVKAKDYGGLYSVVAASFTYSVGDIPNPTVINHSFFDTSLTSATITLDWDDVLPDFGLRHYEVSYGSVVRNINASAITLPADWIGNRVFTVKAVDQRGNKSSGIVKTITKSVPNPVTNLRTQVIDNNVLLYWNLPAKTTLPIQHVLLKKGNSWATAQTIGTKDGGFTSLQELVAGTYRYWVAVIDTDGYQSTPVSVTAQVRQPPDFVFFAKYESQLDGTKSSAYSESNGILLPVNTTETWQDHFTSRSWNTPQDQINAGFPVYIQPTPSSSYYEEKIDYGTVLASSKIAVGYGGEVVSGSPVVSITISTSVDDVTYVDFPDTMAIYATNFRYFKIRFNVTGNGDDLYRINNIDVTLDAKLKNDAGTIYANASDATGTPVTFNVPFVDITALEATPRGTTPLTAVIDFVDAPNPTGFKIYLFNQSGSRVSGDVSWSAKGY